VNEESRKTKSSEEQIPQAPSEEDFVGLFNKVKEYEETLGKHCEIIRQSINKFAQTFEQIKVSIEFSDYEPFWIDEDNEKYFLTVEHHKLYIIRENDGTIVAHHPLNSGFSRNTLKALINSGRLSKFLEHLAETLKFLGEDYAEVRAIAERMAKSVEITEPAEHTNAILKREGAEELGQ